MRFGGPSKFPFSLLGFFSIYQRPGRFGLDIMLGNMRHLSRQKFVQYQESLRDIHEPSQLLVPQFIERFGHTSPYMRYLDSLKVWRILLQGRFLFQLISFSPKIELKVYWVFWKPPGIMNTSWRDGISEYILSGSETCSDAFSIWVSSRMK